MNKTLSTLLTAVCCGILLSSNSALAASYGFGGTLKYRILDGSANGYTYKVGKGKDVTITGTVSAIGYDASDVDTNLWGQKVGVQPTTIALYEGQINGLGTKVCDDSVKVSSGSSTFSASGTTTDSTAKYVFIYKPLNDGYDMSIDGQIKY